MPKSVVTKPIKSAMWADVQHGQYIQIQMQCERTKQRQNITKETATECNLILFSFSTVSCEC